MSNVKRKMSNFKTINRRCNKRCEAHISLIKKDKKIANAAILSFKSAITSLKIISIRTVLSVVTPEWPSRANAAIVRWRSLYDLLSRRAENSKLKSGRAGVLRKDRMTI